MAVKRQEELELKKKLEEEAKRKKIQQAVRLVLFSFIHVVISVVLTGWCTLGLTEIISGHSQNFYFKQHCIEIGLLAM